MMEPQTMMTLPRTRYFLTSLISSLNTPHQPSAASPTPPPSNPLKHCTPAEKSTLLTLHVLFPNELLSALDLLDRELVTRLLPTSASNPAPAAATQTNAPPDQEPPERHLTNDSKSDTQFENAIYYVRSAQQTSSNSRFRDPVASSSHYEVRTSSWCCSCPAFVFSAFPAALADAGQETPEAVAVQGEQDWGGRVGGLSLGDDVPMCKHLLACVLAERAAMFGGYVKTKEVSVEELAGWAAGWGD